MKCKYEKVADRLRDDIEGGLFEVGESLPPENTLARRHGVSRMTVRKAIEVLAEEQLLTRRKGSGTYVSRPPERDTYLYVGPTHGHFENSVYSSLSRQCQRAGHSLTTYSAVTAEDDLSDSAHVEELMDDAAALICDVGDWSEICHLVPDDLPVVVISHWAGIPSVEWLERPAFVISTDPRRAVEMATTYLLDRGHTEVCYFGPGVHGGGAPTHSVRASDHLYAAHRHVLADAGLESAGAVGFPEGGGGPWQERCEQVVRGFVEERGGWPTAFVCEGDFRASPLLRVAIRSGLQLPEDLSVVGLCDTPWAEMLTPQLTSVSLSEDKMASMAVAVSQLPLPDSPTLVRVAPKLIERRSAATATEAGRKPSTT
jgi:GntR family transcriptional regulator of arabinose operon